LINKENTLIVLVGPTASGKTDLAIYLAKKLKTEIVSADSRQFYKEIPVGTAAPDEKQLAVVPHHFVGHLSVRDEYNVSHFEQDVLQLLEEKFQHHRQMIMVGGSGLYIDAVCKGIDELPDPDPAIRKELNELFEQEGIETLRRKLKELDSEYYEIVDRNNPKRLLRAVEVCLQTGSTYTSLRKNEPKERPFDIMKIGLDMERGLLNERINRRTEIMFEQGWLREAEAVYPLKNLNALNTVGFKEIFAFFDGRMTFEEAKEKIKTNTRRFAKRQMTWFKKDKDIRWFDAAGGQLASDVMAYLKENGL
jgi:tRNA dimethylallyltransferase